MSVSQPPSPWRNEDRIIRTPPCSLEAEEAVIGGLLIDNDAWDDVSDLIVEKDFYKKEHQVLFRAIFKLADQGQPFDAVTLFDHLSDAGQGGSDTLGYLATLSRNTPSSANIRSYAEIIHEKSVRRSLIKTANDIIEKAIRPGEAMDGNELLDEAEQSIFEIAEGKKAQQNLVPLYKISHETFYHIDKLYKQGSDVTGLATGFSDIDSQTSGLQNGDLIIIAGRPSMGKTSLALNIAEYAAISQKKGPIAIFSMEMSALQLVMRFYASLGRINQLDLRRGKVKEQDWHNLKSAMELMKEADIFIDDSGSLTPTDIRARSRRLKREQNGLALVIVDYLQLMRVSSSTENRVIEIAEISRSLKAMARELDVPVVVLSQLNREIEKRGDRRPIMSDLRESGAIEQDADLILFISKPLGKDNDTEVENVAEIHAAKQRNGPQFRTKLTFLGAFSRFENYGQESAYAGMEPPRSNADDFADEEPVF